MKIKLLALPLSIVSVTAIPTIVLSSCGGTQDPTDVKVTSITIDASKTTLNIGDSVQLSATVLPNNATNKELEWSVSDSNNSTITSSLIFVPYESGTYTVTAKAKDGSGVTTSKTFTITADETTTESAEEYINDRTFSVQFHATNGYCNGTCWVLADATPEVANDYKYYVATNWHVVQGLKTETFDFVGFACKYGTQETLQLSDFIEFTSFKPKGTSYSTYNNSDKITTQQYVSGHLVEKTGYKGCDIRICEADFSSVLEATQPCKDTVKAKLDKLNQLTASNKKITNIAPITTEKHNFKNLNLYTAGYPAVSEGASFYKWEQHSLKDESIIIDYSNQEEITHWSDDDDTITDCTPQYFAKTSVAARWMAGGASGSMLICDYGSSTNHIWKVCGIFWGGMSDGIVLYPHFSIFKSDWKNFVSTWE